MTDDWEGPRCICGEYVAAIHRECRAMMSADEYEQWSKRP